MKTAKRELEKVANDLNLNVNDLMAVPSFGTKFTLLNKGLANSKFITDNGCNIISLETSDVRFTYTFNTGNVGFNYPEDTVINWSGNEVVSKSDMVLTFRFSARNFYVQRNDTVSLFEAMKLNLNSEFERAGNIMSDKAKKHIKNAIRARLNNGTCFGIYKLVTINDNDETVCLWKNRKIRGVMKMVLSGFKKAGEVSFTKVDAKNKEQWEYFTGKLWCNNCIALPVNHKDGFNCAYSVKSSNKR